MRSVILASIAILGLAACDPAMDPNSPRVALAGDDLRAAFNGKTLQFTPIEDGVRQNETAFASLRSDGTATVGSGSETREMIWTIQGQGLCFRRPSQTPDPDDCRTIGWIQGTRFAVFDTLGFEPYKIADGVITNG